MKKLIYIALLLMMPLAASAQVAKQVEVTKDYTPSVSTAQKLSIMPDMTDTVKMRPDIDYTITPRSYETSLLTENFKPATITYWDYVRQPLLYARGAVGAPLASEVDAYVSAFNKDRGYAMAYVNHWGDYRNRKALDGVTMVDKNTAEMSNRIGGRAGLFVGRHLLEVDVYGDKQLRHRYPTTGDKISFGKMDAKLRFGDDFTDLSRWNFNIEVAGGIFGDGVSLEEQGKLNSSSFGAKAAVGKMVGQHILKIHAEFDGVYGSGLLERYKNSTFNAGFRYGLSGQKLEFLIGADYYYDQVKESAESPHHIFPYMRMTWKNVKTGFVPFVEVDGGLKRHDYGSLLYENPFFVASESAIANIVTAPNESYYAARAGFGGSLGGGLFAYNLSAELNMAEDHFYWYNVGADYNFSSAYEHSLRIDGVMKLRPAGWFEAEANVGVYVWENYDSHFSSRPNFKTSLDLRYLGRKISAGVNLGYQGGIKWMTLAENGTDFAQYKTDSTFTLGVEAQWRINNRWAVYAEGRNLTGSTIYEWACYFKDSAQGIVGVKFTFLRGDHLLKP